VAEAMLLWVPPPLEAYRTFVLYDTDARRGTQVVSYLQTPSAGRRHPDGLQARTISREALRFAMLTLRAGGVPTPQS
ncbi:MAG TPA: hypothetical protein VF154_01395, partial [Terriglobales bacterium]